MLAYALLSSALCDAHECLFGSNWSPMQGAQGRSSGAQRGWHSQNSARAAHSPVPPFSFILIIVVFMVKLCRPCDESREVGSMQIPEVSCPGRSKPRRKNINRGSRRFAVCRTHCFTTSEQLWLRCRRWLPKNGEQPERGLQASACECLCDSGKKCMNKWECP